VHKNRCRLSTRFSSRTTGGRTGGNCLTEINLEMADEMEQKMVCVCMCEDGVCVRVCCSCDVYCNACKKPVSRPVKRMRLDVFMAANDIRLCLSVSTAYLSLRCAVLA